MAKVSITRASRKFNSKEVLAITMSSNAALKLDQLTQDGDEVIIKPAAWCELTVEPDGKDPFTQYIVIDDTGHLYATGSTTFWDTFQNIDQEMKRAAAAGEEDAQDYEIRIFRMPSKKYTGKTFITCGILF